MDNKRTLKLELKEWEHSFAGKHKRPPTPDDIRCHPEIAAKYKQYRRLSAQVTPPKPSMQTPLPTCAHVPTSNESSLKSLDDNMPMITSCAFSAFTPSTFEYDQQRNFEHICRLAQGSRLTVAAAEEENDDYDHILPNSNVASRARRSLSRSTTFEADQASLPSFNFEQSHNNDGFASMDIEPEDEHNNNISHDQSKEHDPPSIEDDCTIELLDKESPKKTKRTRKTQKSQNEKDTLENSWAKALRPMKRKLGKASQRRQMALVKPTLPLRPGQQQRQLDSSRQVSGNFKKYKLAKPGQAGHGNRFKSKNWGAVRSLSSVSTTVGVSDLNEDEVPFAVWSSDTSALDETNRPAVVFTNNETPKLHTEEEEGMDICDSSLSSVDVNQELHRLFGFNSFRHGQEQAIRSILNRRSVLLVLGTGAGKSLCYQLPAAIFSRFKVGFTLVVSPLISLMTDQLRSLPKGLKGALISSQQQPSESDKIIGELNEGRLDVLFVSPEKLCIKSFQSSITRPVAFVCVDEVHCASEWSHNFRPSYMRLGETLRKVFGNPCVLALTATLTARAQEKVCELFEISAEDVIQGSLLRDNLELAVTYSLPHQRINELVHLLHKKFKANDSVIIYCTKQAQADEVAFQLRARQIDAASYHAGKTAADRSFVQSAFMSGEMPIVVATIAFGMGLNKMNVRGVIHYNLPKSMENYIQEIGRAGRDGNVSHCQVFLDETDYHKLRSLCFGCSVDSKQIDGLLDLLVPKQPTRQSTFTTSIAIDRTAIELDLRKETLETLLNHLAQHPSAPITVMPATYTSVSVLFVRSDPNELAQTNELVAHILKIGVAAKSSKASRQTAFKISSLQLCNAMDVSLADVMAQLKSLQREREIKYEVCELGFPVTVNLLTFQLDVLKNDLMDLVHKLEHSSVVKVDQVYKIMRDVAAVSSDQTNQQKHMLNTATCEYFSALTSQALDPSNTRVVQLSRARLVTMSADVRLFVRQHRSQIDSGLCVARILQGLSSTRYPAMDWFRNPYWGRYVDVPFEDLRRIATRALDEAQVVTSKQED